VCELFREKYPSEQTALDEVPECSAAFARLVVAETACLTSNVLASWVTRLPIEPPMAGARTVSQAEILLRATQARLANDLDLRSTTINE
jgi:hypothetical protein